MRQWTSVAGSAAVAVAVVLALGAARPAWAQVKGKLDRPPASALDPALVREAARGAVTSGIASLLARQAAPGNGTGLVFPPIPRTIREVTVKYARKSVEVPVYEDVYEKRLVAVRDEYGAPTGFEERPVLVRRVLKGTRTEERLVPDPDGDVERTHRRVVRGEGGTSWLPRGLVGLNGAALYVYAKAGLPRDGQRDELAAALADLVEQTGMPELTWDLAWLSAGLVAHGDPAQRELTQRVLGRLIDGQVREKGAAAGLWGPVSIHYPSLARGIELTVAAAREVEKARAAMEAASDGPRAAQAQAQQRLQRLVEQQDELNRKLDEVSRQGRRLGQATARFKIGEQWELPGLPYDIYNAIIADLDSTAAAAFALDEAQRAGVLPRQTLRVPIGNRPLAPAENTAATVAAAVRAVAAAQLPHGGWHAGNVLTGNSVFAGAPLGRGSLEVDGKLPPLLSPESVRSNLAGGAAALHLSEVGGGGAAARAAARRATPRLLAMIDAWLDAPATALRTRIVYRGESDAYEALVASKGWIDVPPWQERPTAELPLGHVATPFDLLPGALALARYHTADPADPATTPTRAGVYEEVAYRVLLMQQDSGQWTDTGGAPTASSGEQAETLRAAAVRIALQNPDGKRAPRALDRLATTTMGHISDLNTVPRGAFGTLMALAFLLERPVGEIDLSTVAILPDPTESDPDTAAATAPDGDPTELTPDDDAAKVKRPNPALDALVAKVRASS